MCGISVMICLMSVPGDTIDLMKEQLESKQISDARMTWSKAAESALMSTYTPVGRAKTSKEDW